MHDANRRIGRAFSRSPQEYRSFEYPSFGCASFGCAAFKQAPFKFPSFEYPSVSYAGFYVTRRPRQRRVIDVSLRPPD